MDSVDKLAVMREKLSAIPSSSKQSTSQGAVVPVHYNSNNSVYEHHIEQLDLEPESERVSLVSSRCPEEEELMVLSRESRV